ncbi:endoglucanase 25-like [Henckelia pumila]|uniref:endoglucanase 25-like n=1 Tax=Henckelia pumila TaxID=405737 RepID=UPI003C6E5ABC
MSESSETEFHSGRFVHSASESGRLIPPSSRWNSTELDFHFLPRSVDGFDTLPSRFSKSVDFNLTIGDRAFFKRCVYTTIFAVVFVPVLVLLLHFLTHKNEDNGGPKNLSVALKQALLFFDAQKSGHFPGNSTINFRGDSGLNDGKDGETDADLVGGYYDSGNNIKFSFSTAYTVTLLSWTVIEYRQKYADLGELDHIKDIIKWGTDYLLKVFIPPATNQASAVLYSQVGGNDGSSGQENDISCWQKPEDMKYTRHVSVCDDTAADLAGEIVSALSAASLVLVGEKEYSAKLVEAAEKLFNLATRQDQSHKPGKYTQDGACGGLARDFYNSTTYVDELVWGGTWLFFATGNSSYLKYSTDKFDAAEMEEMASEKAVFYWNNKFTANAVLMTRIRYFIDLGYPYEDALATNRTDLLMCSYLSNQNLSATNGGLVLLIPDTDTPLQYAATASFLSKLYSDYLELLSRTGGSCNTAIFSVQMLRDFSMSQVNYILGDNPMKMSYMVGYGDRYPLHVHHRAASIPPDGKQHSCSEGNGFLKSKDKNPNILSGAIVAGPDKKDAFYDDRAKPWFTEPSITSNAGLVAALVALLDPDLAGSADSDGHNLGIDKMGIFQHVH